MTLLGWEDDLYESGSVDIARKKRVLDCAEACGNVNKACRLHLSTFNSAIEDIHSHWELMFLFKP